MPETVAIIPARFGSTRFPGKPLADDTGKPLIQHVVEAAARAERVDRVLVATDDQRICDAVGAWGGVSVMTATTHPNGASRLAEAADIIGLEDDDTIVNVQGDEPEIDPVLIDAAVDTLLASDAHVATIASPFAAGEDPADPNIVKVVVGVRGEALYFSRAVIPHHREMHESAAASPLKHVGLYVYRRPFLRKYIALDPTPLEQTERLEQLRILEHGVAITVAVRTALHTGVDTPEQYAAFVSRHRAAQDSS